MVARGAEHTEGIAAAACWVGEVGVGGGWVDYERHGGRRSHISWRHTSTHTERETPPYSSRHRHSHTQAHRDTHTHIHTHLLPQPPFHSPDTTWSTACSTAPTANRAPTNAPGAPSTNSPCSPPSGGNKGLVEGAGPCRPHTHDERVSESVGQSIDRSSGRFHTRTYQGGRLGRLGRLLRLYLCLGGG